VIDSVGTNDGTPSNITYEAGITGQRAVFGGGGTISKITIGQIPLSTQMSVVMRIKLSKNIPTTNNQTGVMCINNQDSATHYLFNGSIYMSILTGTRKTIGSGVITDRTIEHTLTITANTTTNVWKFYQNDTLVYTGTVGTLAMITAPYIGASGPNFWLEGSMDEISFWDTELTQAQIVDINAKLESGQSLI